MAFLRSCVGADFILYANSIGCFPSGRCMLVLSSYNLLVWKYASTCDRFVGGTK